MSLLLTGEDLLDIEQHDHPFARIYLANTGNELLIDSGPYRVRWRGDIFSGEVQYFSHRVYNQAGLDTAQIDNDDARAVVGWLDIEFEAFSRVQHGNHLPAQIGDALNELGRLRHFGGLGEAVDFLDLRNRNAVLFGAQQTSPVDLADFLSARSGALNLSVFLRPRPRGDLRVAELLVLHEMGTEDHDQPWPSSAASRQFHPTVRCDPRRVPSGFGRVQNLMDVIHHQPRHEPSASTTMMRWSSWMF
jgi:hypothetical protein